MTAPQRARCFPELLPCARSTGTKENHHPARKEDRRRMTSTDSDGPHSLPRCIQSIFSHKRHKRHKSISLLLLSFLCLFVARSHSLLRFIPKMRSKNAATAESTFTIFA